MFYSMMRIFSPKMYRGGAKMLDEKSGARRGGAN